MISHACHDCRNKEERHVCYLFAISKLKSFPTLCPIYISSTAVRQVEENNP